MEPKISIIMPVYGVEAFVGKAIESIQKQTFQDWEMFAVDDGSPDMSGSICDKYASEDCRIHVIHKENGGAPSARNIAIDQASGKYLYFMDSDDWAENTMLEDMYNLAEKTNSQYVITGYFIDTYYSDIEKYTQEQYVDDITYESQEDFRRDSYRLFDKNLLYTPWNKLYLASYIKDKGIYFPNTFWDDFPFNLKVIRDVEKVAVSSKKYYHFIRKRAESETAKYRPDMFDKREEEDAWLRELYAYWNISDENVEEFLARRYIERIIGCIENLTNPNCTLPKATKKQQIKQMINMEKTRKALKIAKPKSKYMKIMLLPVRWKSTSLTYLEGVVISRVKSRHIRTFAKLKANR